MEAVLKADGQLLARLHSSSMRSRSSCRTRLQGTYERGAAVQFVMDAFGHLKAIGAEAAKPLLDKAGVEPDDGVTGIGKDFIQAARIRFWDREKSLSQARLNGTPDQAA